MSGRHRADGRPDRWLAGAAHGGTALLVAVSLGSGLAVAIAMRDDPAGERVLAVPGAAAWRGAPTGGRRLPPTSPQPQTVSAAPTTIGQGEMTVASTTTVAPQPAPARSTAPTTVQPAGGTCRTVGWGGVKRHVALAGDSLVARFGLNPVSIAGVGERALPTSDHPKGLALDFFVDRRLGDELSTYVRAHRDNLAVTYVIWRQRIDNGDGWRPMAGRGSPTANHYDHVHVSFRATGSGAELTC
jgi:hypothetical protein